MQISTKRDSIIFASETLNSGRILYEKFWFQSLADWVAMKVHGVYWWSELWTCKFDRAIVRIAIVSPESWFTRRRSPGLRFARWHTTLYNMVNLLLRDVILVNLGFNMYSHCLSMLNPFFSSLENDKYSSGESTYSGPTPIGRNDPIPKNRTSGRLFLQEVRTHVHFRGKFMACNFDVCSFSLFLKVHRTS